MATYTFGQIPDLIAKYEKRMEMVVQDSAKRAALGMKYRTRRKTGFLRASLLASTDQMPVIDRDSRPDPSVMYRDDDTQIALVIAGASLGQTLYFGFTAGYAIPREYQDGMVRLEAQQWPHTVEQVCRDAIARFR